MVESEKAAAAKLSRRERQILDIVFQLGDASAKDVMEAMADAPSYSAVRALLGRMVEKGVIEQYSEGKRYLYRSCEDKQEASSSALKKLMKTFFQSSPSQLVSALLGMKGDELSDDEIDALEKALAVAKAKRKSEHKQKGEE